MRQESIQKKKNGVKKDISKSYNQFKEFEGKKYNGMKVGRTHKWYYDKGEWKEKKITRRTAAYLCDVKNGIAKKHDNNWRKAQRKNQSVVRIINMAVRA